ncbi:hypothetical protein [Agarilytica rhodophyticola]|uniref:hypothetical protein n=1 Tax=Agarilytica rhodophyticola TaxID=1737490 RepID=UPI000B346F8F|nr:hypothetical protein [Agarilytica rhodophyticola]
MKETENTEKKERIENIENTYYVIKPFFIGNVRKKIGSEMQLNKHMARPYVNGGFLTLDKNRADTLIRDRIDVISKEIDELKRILSPIPKTRTTTKKEAL